MDSDEQVLWLRWRQARTPDVRDALIVHYSPWARQVARDVFMRVYLMRDAWHDCVQNALMGLMEAIERFDPDRGVAFQPFARLRVRGAVFDGLRVLRNVHLELGYDAAHRSALAKDRAESLHEEGYEDPLEAFIATTVGLGIGFLLDMQSMPSHMQSADAYAALEKAELSAAVSESLDQLAERERAIVVLHYYHQLSFVDIAEQLGVTKGRISQLHKRALENLRCRLRERVMTEC
ncbi:sigma-70 family RNA polymerase sigma factor [Dyella caseinilytica]|uniref:Sigma-70 family RNA polymerase sigma factor n=1 Tax=Dyella caseinilytica TaxID=1849581 RepID=A0ABX7GNV0_9GAMM|nr:sigma-70 family RNA polymerase sigma factor [Dyella caseinilytica]QRN52052.1 sigma-70 family RNA polymerase sigma factor [Dyella caseinilytica]GGA15832.1 RNA polymerase sigma factor [Dyella caseinilytica]